MEAKSCGKGSRELSTPSDAPRVVLRWWDKALPCREGWQARQDRFKGISMLHRFCQMHCSKQGMDFSCSCQGLRAAWRWGHRRMSQAPRPKQWVLEKGWVLAGDALEF